MGVDWFASLLDQNDESPLKGKILSIVYAYQDCTQINNGAYKINPLSTFISHGVMNKLSSSNMTLFRLTGEDSLYKSELNWMLSLEKPEQMVAEGYRYLLYQFQNKKNYQDKLDDIWTAIGYINAFSEYPHEKTEEILNWAINVINQNEELNQNSKSKSNTTSSSDINSGTDFSLNEGLPWPRVQGMIYDDDRMLLSLEDQVIESIRLNQLDTGGWPHQFGTYNQVWAAILILRFLRMVDDVNGSKRDIQ
ncbi:MAG: hypothetical protein ACLFUI_06665 [Halanaerobiales bacterium]